MRGEVVVIKAFGGQAITARVWESDRQAVYVVTDDVFSQLQTGDGPIPAGFQRQDVFRYDPELEPLIKSGFIDWKRLERWQEYQA